MANISSYNQLSSWNEDDDLLFVQQPDAPKKAHPSQMKEYVLSDMDEVPTQDSNKPVKSGGVFSTMAVPKYDSANKREYYEGGAAFDGNIDSVPVAGSNNAVASGGTKTYVDNAVSAALDGCRIAVFEQTFTGVNISKAWGSLYESTTSLQFDISSLGLQTAPKFAIVALKSAGAALIFTAGTPTATAVSFRPIRPSAATDLTIVATLLVLY